MINVLGDALAAGIIAHLCRKDFPLSDAGKVQSFGGGVKTPRVRVNLPACLHDNSNLAKVKEEVSNLPRGHNPLWSSLCLRAFMPVVSC